MKYLLLILLFPFAVFSQNTMLISNDTLISSGYVDLEKVVGYDVDLWLPDTMPFIVGQTTKVFYNQMTFEPVLFNNRTTLSGTSTVGQFVDSGFVWTPTIEEVGTMTVNVTFNNRIIDTRTMVCIAKNAQPLNLRMMPVGDSVTEFGWDKQNISLNNCINGTITSVGEYSTNGYYHEGVGGKFYISFAYNTSWSPFIHNGNLDFPYFFSTKSITPPDIVRIMLGNNDIFYNNWINEQQLYDTLMSCASHMVDSLRSQYPNIMIFLTMPITHEITGVSWSKAYGSWLSPLNINLQTTRVRTFIKDVYSVYGNGKKDSKVQVDCSFLLMNRDLGYKHVNGIPTNDAVHPNTYGNYTLGRSLANNINYYYK